MTKIMVEVYLPSAQKSFDVQIPADTQLSQTKALIAHALSQMSNGLFSEKSESLLCDRATGKILNINMTAFELGLKNGSKLMLI